MPPEGPISNMAGRTLRVCVKSKRSEFSPSTGAGVHRLVLYTRGSG